MLRRSVISKVVSFWVPIPRPVFRGGGWEVDGPEVEPVNHEVGSFDEGESDDRLGLLSPKPPFTQNLN